MKRVVVTGMGAITPIGLNVEDYWNGLKEGKIGFGEITKFDTTDYKVHLAAEVKGFQGKDYMDFKAAKRMELFAQYAVAAAKEAIEQSGLDMEKEDPLPCGMFDRFRYRQSSDSRERVRQADEKGTKQSESSDGSTDDL